MFNRGRTSPAHTLPTRTTSTTNEQILEDYNNKQAQQLGNKVSMIKSLSQQIKIEIEESNNLLSQVDTNIDETGSLLDTALLKLKTITDNDSSKNTLYLVFFVIFMFIALWLFI
mmetsp:Transcript_6258/g.9762  ORF Transcript_6258/g.9762 Transcript_6258/m.9762 type:complete len:114 (+) Transcript_6258:53-394(+)